MLNLTNVSHGKSIIFLIHIRLIDNEIILIKLINNNNNLLLNRLR